MSQTVTERAERTAGLEGAEGRCLDLDATFHLLQNERRRLVLRYLLEHARWWDTDGTGDDQGRANERIEMRELAEQVAAWEHDTTVANLSSDERQRVYIGLYQSHLPTLAEHDVIDYEQSRGWVEPTPLCAELEPYLGPSPECAGTAMGATGTGDGMQVPADATAAPTDSPTRTVGGRHLLVATALLVPLVGYSTQAGPTVAISGALLGVMLVTMAVLGGGLDRMLGRALRN